MLQKKPKTAPWGHHSCQSQPQVFKNYHQELWKNHMGVSKNRGTPKSSILIGVSIINHPFWGTLIFGNTHMWHPLVASWVDSCQALHHDELEFGHWNQPEAPEWNLLENPLPVEKCLNGIQEKQDSKPPSNVVSQVVSIVSHNADVFLHRFLLRLFWEPGRCFDWSNANNHKGRLPQFVDGWTGQSIQEDGSRLSVGNPTKSHLEFFKCWNQIH